VKGTIIACLRDLVVTRQGADAWHAVLDDAGCDTTSIFMLNEDVDDAACGRLFASAMTVLSLPREQLFDAFGLQWCLVHAPKIYKAFYTKHRNARGFFLDVNQMHERLTAAIPNARPPVFEVVVSGDHSLLVKYESSRGLVDLAIGLARGMGAYFKESITVEKLSDASFRIDFPPRDH